MNNYKSSINDKLSNQKCALYIRVSTHWQIDKDSLPVQREDLINYAKYALNIDKYEIFEDAGYSAKKHLSVLTTISGKFPAHTPLITRKFTIQHRTALHSTKPMCSKRTPSS